MPVPRDSATLVTLAKAGDERAFDELFHIHYHYVLAICRHRLLDREEAEDAATASFVSAYTHLRSLKKNSSFTSYLRQIAENECLDRHRKAGRASRLEHPSVSLDQDENLASLLPDGRGDAEQQSTDRVVESALIPRIEQAINQALTSLPVRERYVLHAHYVRQIKVDDMLEEWPELFGRKPSRATFFRRLKEAKAKLRELLEDQGITQEAIGEYLNAH